MGKAIEREIGANAYGLSISFSYDRPDCQGTLGAIRGARELLGDRFLVLYGDTYLTVDMKSFFAGWSASGLLGGMTVIHNQGLWDASNVDFHDNVVSRYDKSTVSDEALSWIDYGLTGLHCDALDLVDSNDLAPLFTRLAAATQLFGFPVETRFYEIGTPAALAETDVFLRGLQSLS
jgi:N-acetyl-alpha-D-muramate 1-phosphate uridylyltransferase